MLIAKGWGIVRYKLPAQGRMKLGVYCTFYLCTSIGSFLITLSQPQPSITVSTLQNIGGYILTSLRLCGFVWFNYACFTTWNNFTIHKIFYRYPLTFINLSIYYFQKNLFLFSI